VLANREKVMSKTSRREVLSLGTALLGAAATGVGRAAGAPPKNASGAIGADLVLLNGRIYTVEDSTPRAEAFAVLNGRFIAVGASDEIRSFVGKRTEIIDAQGMTVTPGFIDAHSHPAWGGIEELVNVNLDLRSIDEIVEAIRARAAETPPGEWVLGFKYDDTKVKDGRQIDIEDLDAAAPDHPVYVVHRGGHTHWYNSAAFARAGVNAQTPDPPGGRIFKKDGRLTGLVAERANELFDRVRPSGSTREQREAGVAIISEMMTAAGLTSVHEAQCSKDYAVAYQDAYHAGRMRFRVALMVQGEELYRDLKTAGLYSGFGDEWLRVAGVKFVADGSASERTMAMSTPYVGRPDDYGILTMTQEEVDAAVEDAHRNRFQIGIHANGDVAIDRVLNSYERVQQIAPRPDPRHRIEHCSLITPDLLRRIRASGSIPTPFYTYVHYHGDKWSEYGEEKMQSMFAHRSFLDYGIPVAGASDYIPGPYEPLMAIQSMVTRTDMNGRVWGRNQRISVDEALKICTQNGAYASFEEDLKGSIRPGKLADFTILADDPHDVTPERIKHIEVVRTTVGGRTMHLKS
jgi:predicted amidohydrolase YtcJ